MRRLLLLTIGLTILLSSAYSFAAVVGSSGINALAVDTTNNTGNLTPINLTVSNGTGNVIITGPAVVQSSTTQSATTAAQYAATYLGLNYSNYNYSYYINSPGGNVSGPSAGAAMTLLAISALSHKHLNSGMIITGTISQDGSIGAVGGIYDKVTAAGNAGASFVLVPSAPQGSAENMLYALVQANTGVPLIEVANISQAYAYAFGKSPNLSGVVTYMPFVNYYPSQLPQATTTCSNGCNMSTFGTLLNKTFDLGSAEIALLSSDSSFAHISSQLAMVLNQSEQVGGKGYLYAAANIAFLNYINSFYFAHHDTSIPSALATATGVQSYCSSLMPPQLTSTNYEYVMSGELRQYWANYTVNASIEAFNSTSLETDEVLDNIYLAGQASGWCNAANILYGLTSNSTGTAVSFSQGLKATSLSRISRAASYGNNLYITTARQAYAQGNYGVAILDSDFAFSFGNATYKDNLTTQQLLNLSSATASGATYGAWGTQYNIESQFYSQEAELSSANITQAHQYAAEAYSTALLASQISNDTMLIHGSLVSNSTAQAAQQQNQQLARIASNINSIQLIVYAIAAAVVVIIVLNLILIWIVLSRLPHKRSRK
ncbi:MAG TPA: S16 family serine protease [Candidatus Acidoferrales bacterium]|nr:S16 family serine protease [Candidatus Acidoferrales bacterium]